MGNISEALNLQNDDSTKLVVLINVIIPNSDDCSRNDRSEEGLYGNSFAEASFEITYNLLPQGNYKYTYRMYPEWRVEPEIKLVGCTAFYTDKDGGEHEREFELTEEQYKKAKREALTEARSIRDKVRVLA